MENQVNGGDQNTQQIGQNPIDQPAMPTKKRKTNYLLIAGIVLTCLVVLGFVGLGGYYLGLQSPNKFLKPASNKINQLKNIKIGHYEIVSRIKGNKGWEEVEYKGVREASDESMIYSIFSELYPTYTDNKTEFYVKDIKLKGETAEVYFGGDETAFTNRMGTTGPYNYAGLLTFALTEDPRIKKVHLNIQKEGVHAGPTPPEDRKDFLYLWTESMLRNAADQGNDKAREILEFRTNP